MKIIGLTGGIGVGKSTVSSYLKDKNFIIIDADLISHEITKPGMPVLKEIANAFGKDVLNEDNSLNRNKLASIAFSNKKNHALLESIITSQVVEHIIELLNEYEANGIETVILDAPLLFETGMDKYCDKILMITSSMETRIKRVMERDGISKNEIICRIKNQMAEEIKAQNSDFIINNDGSIENLYEELDRIFGVNK